MAYRHMAAVYDALMADAPYGQWLDWAERAWSVDPPVRVIELGCGTGNIAIPLARRGFRVTGVDLSAEMLAVACDKARRNGVHVQWVEQDIRELDLHEADAVISFCDSLSYLTEEADVREVFRRAFHHLRPGGWLLFDVHSPHKVLHGFGDQTFALADGDINYIWECATDPERMEVEHRLTFFVSERDGLYRRFDEVHHQRAYHSYQLARWLAEAGFADVKITADFADEPPHPESERLFFRARRP